jgi:hypothetical protein
MKFIIFLAALVVSSVGTAAVSLRAGMATISCANKMYSVTAYTDAYGTEGTAIISRHGKIVNITALVKSGGNGKQVGAAGLEMVLNIDTENQNRGTLEFEEGDKVRKVKFSDFQCSSVPKSWPNPGQIE